MDSTSFRKHGYAMIDRIAKYYEQIEKYPVKAQTTPGQIKNQLPANMPDNAEQFDNIENDIEKIIMPGITHWQHPGFMAMFPSNASFPSILGELFCAGLGVNTMFWDTSPAAAELEEQMLNWLRDAMSLPKTFQGVIHDTASSSTLTAIICAREKFSEYSINENGFIDFTQLTMYCSNQAHYSVEKGARAAGIGKAHIRKIEVDENFAMHTQSLEETIQNDIANNKKPFMVVATLGTTNSLAFDPLDAISEICKKYNLWLHVDAAYAGSAFIIPSQQHFLKGVDGADSFVFNPHKWLMTNFDCSCFYVTDTKHLINTYSHTPDYINAKPAELVNNYKDWGLPLGRRFRALKLWFVMRSFGLKGLQNIIQGHLDIANNLNQKFLRTEHWEIMAPFAMNVICVRYHPKNVQDADMLNKLNEQILQAINNSGKFFLTGTRLNQKYVIRIVPGQQNVTQNHTDVLFTMLNETAKRIFSQEGL